jgi:amidase
MAELYFQTLSETCRQLKSGALTSVKLTELMLERVAQKDAQLHAYALVLAEQALQQAAARDARRAAGDPLGALHGVPIAIKDLVYTRGIPTASGTRVMADFRPDFDATVLTKLVAAGAVIIGKTQLTEGAFGAHHPQIVAPVNPYAADHWPGVSSSGSGVAVASGLAFAALGSDTGGSIRFPSACCGLVGLKPTYGRVSRHGVFPLAESLDHIGPMTRCVEDAARVLGVIAGADPEDKTSLPDPVPNYLAYSTDNLKGTRIGIDWRYVTSGVDADVIQVIEKVCEQFSELGADIVEVALPAGYRELVDGWGVTCAVECAQAHRNYYPERNGEYGPILSALIDLGLALDRSEYVRLEGVRQEFRTALDDLLTKVNILIAPCMTSLPPTVEAMNSAVEDDAQRAAFITFTAPFDYSGHPTLTLPAGLNVLGLPESFQLIGPALGEPALLRAGSAYELAAGRMPHPPMA